MIDFTHFPLEVFEMIIGKIRDNVGAYIITLIWVVLNTASTTTARERKKIPRISVRIIRSGSDIGDKNCLLSATIENTSFRTKEILFWHFNSKSVADLRTESRIITDFINYRRLCHGFSHRSRESYWRRPKVIA